jgi:hypothetical protein
MFAIIASVVTGASCVMLMAAKLGQIVVASTHEREKKKKNGFGTIADKFTTLAEVEQALRASGLEASQLIIGIDFTKSNESNGEKSFGGRCLHDLLPNAMNPYQRAIDIIGRTLEKFDDDKMIPVYGFGDENTKDKTVMAFNTGETPCFGVSQVLARYNEIIPTVQLSGPTTFAPLIKKAIDIVKETSQYHILLILTDGDVTNKRETTAAIIEASKYPLSIVTVDIGDADFTLMHEYDDELPERQFDNFQFVEFSKIINNPRVENADVAFAVEALQEIPDQYKAIKRLGLL